MEHADFVHLVRASEQASAEDARAYRRQVALFAALGYAWVIGCLLLAIALLGWVGYSFSTRHFKGYHVWMVLSGLGLLWVCLRALWVRFPPDEGIELTRKDAPALFEALTRIRSKVKGPPIHRVFLTGDFNASISQRARFGLAGGVTNRLEIGLPLLMALDRRRVLAVLAHEYGHLRGDHGRFSAWIYRTRVSWTRLYESMDSENVVGWLTQGFLQWYFPRFVARTFAMARSDEYEADRISARLVGADAAAAALSEITVKSEWLQTFWQAHWGSSGRHPLPVGPYAAMRTWLGSAPPPVLAHRVFREELRRISGHDDTHPVLRDRLEALDIRPALPEWSQKPALELLGKRIDWWIARFDKAWAAENAEGWKRHHVRMRRLFDRIQVLEREGTATALAEAGDLYQRLGQEDPARQAYWQALAMEPDQLVALRGAWETGWGEPLERRRAWAERVHELAPEFRWWAARSLVEAIEAQPDHATADLQAWRARLKEAEAAEDRAIEELQEGNPMARTSGHGLQGLALEEVLDELQDYDVVRRAWLLRKELRQFPRRPCWVLVVDGGDIDEDDAAGLCGALRRSMPLPGPVLALPAGTQAHPRDLDRIAGAALPLRAPRR